MDEDPPYPDLEPPWSPDVPPPPPGFRDRRDIRRAEMDPELRPPLGLDEAYSEMLLEADDPVLALRALMRTRAYLEVHEGNLVARARRRGTSWDDIAAALGTTRQRVAARHRTAGR